MARRSKKRLQREAVERWSAEAARFSHTIQTFDSWSKLAHENARFANRHDALLTQARAIQSAMLETRAMIASAENVARGIIPENARLSDVAVLSSLIITMMDGSVAAMRDFCTRANLEMQILSEFAAVPVKSRALYKVQDYSAVPVAGVRQTMVSIGLRGFVQNFMGDFLGIRR